MSAQQLFYGTIDDMLPGLLRAEQRVAIKYVVSGSSALPHFREYRTSSEISDLGHVLENDWNLTPSYMIMPPTQRVKVERVKQRAGGVRYFADASRNRDVLTFSPSGLCQGSAIICGRVGRTDDTQAARQMYKLVTRELLRGFDRCDVYWVGPSALSLLRDGWRLTPSLRWSNEADLKWPDRP